MRHTTVGATVHRAISWRATSGRNLRAGLAVAVPAALVTGLVRRPAPPRSPDW